MFLKFLFLRREGKNLFSCSNTSKNVFYLIKPCGPLFHFFAPRLFYQRESGAKVRQVFVTSKFLKNFFQKICIYQNLAVTLHPICDWNCGSKAKMVHKNIFDFFYEKIWRFKKLALSLHSLLRLKKA